MALPTTISGHSFPTQNYFCGPFKSSGGNFYCILLGALNAISALKASDPTDAFTVQDAGNQQVGGSGFNLWVHQVADVLHVVEHQLLDAPTD